MTPFDVIKTRLQTQLPAPLIPTLIASSSNPSSSFSFTPSSILSHHHPRHLSGFWDALSKIVRHEGLSAMWRGTAPALAMSVPGQVVYMVGYDWGRRTLLANPPNWAWSTTSTSNPTRKLTPIYITLVPLLCGSMSRTLVAALVSPLELLRTRLQSSTATTSLSSIFQSLRAEGGFRNAWRGLPPTLWRDVPFSGIYWAGYEGFKRVLTGGKGMGEGWDDEGGVLGEFGIAFTSGAGSGMIAATLTNPFDVVKTRRQASITPISSPSRIASTEVIPTKTFALLIDIARKEGWTALMKGLTPRLAKVGPACGIMVGCYEGLGKWLD